MTNVKKTMEKMDLKQINLSKFVDCKLKQSENAKIEERYFQNQK